MAHTVEGRVAKILSDTHLIVNLGAMHGIKAGTVFAILAEGDEVKDPETGETLGKWEVPKGFVIATHVQDRLSTCQAYQMKGEDEEDEDPRTRVLSGDMISLSLRAHSMIESSAKLQVNPRDVSGMPRIGPISVGDKVRARMDIDEAATE